MIENYFSKSSTEDKIIFTYKDALWNSMSKDEAKNAKKMKFEKRTIVITKYRLFLFRKGTLKAIHVCLFILVFGVWFFFGFERFRLILGRLRIMSVLSFWKRLVRREMILFVVGFFWPSGIYWFLGCWLSSFSGW